MQNKAHFMKNKEDFEIAQLTSKDETAITKAQCEVKSETGKDLVLIAWEEKKH